jgi:hypothetical protein
MCAAFSAAAKAECVVPNVLSNGQVADATQVMDNFNAVADCAEAAAENSVTQTGTPQAGAIAVYSGAQTITGGDLTGDVTTLGSTATTLADTGVTPGSYISPNISIDSKGRITAATSGTGGSGTAIVSARVRLEANQALVASDYTLIQFDTLEFEGVPGLWGGAPDHAFVVPAGVNRAEVVGSSGVTTADLSGYWQFFIRKNGVSIVQDAASSDFYGMGVLTTGVIAVAPGDELTFLIRSSANKTIGNTGTKPFMSIKLWSE